MPPAQPLIKYSAGNPDNFMLPKLYENAPSFIRVLSIK